MTAARMSPPKRWGFGGFRSQRPRPRYLALRLSCLILLQPPHVLTWRRAEGLLEVAREVRSAFVADLERGVAGAQPLTEHELTRRVQTKLLQVAHGADAGDGREAMRKVRLAHAHVARHLL